MLKKLALIFFSLCAFLPPLFALTLSVNVAKDSGNEFSTIHIKEDLAFKCFSEHDEYDKLIQIQCVFPREPKEKFKAMETNFFKIDSFVNKKKYYIRVRPLQKMKLFPIAYSLLKHENIFQANLEKPSSHWMILGYTKELPLIRQSQPNAQSINFPIDMQEVSLPSVGALDVAGNPIIISKLQDVTDFMRIKSAYEAGDYTHLAKDADAIFREFPETIFEAELNLYKIRGYHQTDESEELLVVAKDFLWEHSDDENVPEVLAYMANAYSAVGLQSDALYFYERLFKEYPDSKYSALGMIFLGDQQVAGGKAKEAKKYFEKALYKTKDVEIASMAAVRLAKISLEQGDLERASTLYTKIIEGNPKYLLHDVEENYDTARSFYNRGQQRTAADILIAMTENLPKNDDRYEMMQRDIGLYLSETKQKAEAYKALKAYLVTYGEDAEYALEVQKALDSLFYAPEDANKTALLAEYENLESKYANEEIGQKAALEKAKLLNQEKKYQDVLDMKGSGVEREEGYETIETEAALALAMDSLAKGRCSQAIVLSSEYNLTIESKFDKELYSCAFQTGNYELAKRTAIKHLKDSERLGWLYKYAKTLNKLGEYEELIKVSKDIVTLSALEKTDKYDDILQDTFYAEQRMGNTQGMVTTIKELERRRGLVSADIELYVEMIKLGLKQHDDVVIETYTKKVMGLQKRTASYSQSPFVEFAALQVLKAQKKEKEQMALLRELVKREMTDKEISRVQYMYGSLLMKEGKNTEAKSAFETSMKADEKSAWAGLSKDALSLLKED